HIAIEEEINLDNIANPTIRIGDYDISYLKIETKDYLGCSLFGDFLNFSKRTYCFNSPQMMFVKLGGLEKAIRTFYSYFKKDFGFDRSSFIINQTCHENHISCSWFGFGPKNYIQALREQSKRYSEAGFVRPHHREVACFLSVGQNFNFYIALQSDVVKENDELNFDYMQVGFIFGNMPFNNKEFIDFYKKAGLEEPDFVEEKELYYVEKDISNMRFNLNKEGSVIYNDRECWVSKIILENPFYDNKAIDKVLSAHKKIVVNLIDHHQLDKQKNYFLKEFHMISIPYGNFPFSALRILGNW
ncbi:MAG TPA: hypothetical protein VIO11_03270, partial [Candidatus Methanoperedens sp.]